VEDFPLGGGEDIAGGWPSGAALHAGMIVRGCKELPSPGVRRCGAVATMRAHWRKPMNDLRTILYGRARVEGAEIRDENGRLV